MLVFRDVKICGNPVSSRMLAPAGIRGIPPPLRPKEVMYGGFDCASGEITHSIGDRKCGMNSLIFMIASVKSYGGFNLRRLYDNGYFHHSGPVQEWLGNPHRITFFWRLP